MSCLTRSIHAPGFGRNRSQPGRAANSRNGSPIPRATAANIPRITGAGCPKAKPRAVPNTGAVQALARTVARTPWKNAPGSPSRGASPASVDAPGRMISKTPSRLRAKTNTTAVNPSRNNGFWK